MLFGVLWLWSTTFWHRSCGESRCPLFWYANSSPSALASVASVPRSELKGENRISEESCPYGEKKKKKEYFKCFLVKMCYRPLSIIEHFRLKSEDDNVPAIGLSRKVPAMIYLKTNAKQRLLPKSLPPSPGFCRTSGKFYTALKMRNRIRTSAITAMIC